MNRLLAHLREPVNGLSHYIAALLGLVGLGVLVWLAPPDDLTRRISLIVYGASLVFMFVSSSAYHLVQGSPEQIARLRKIDHTAIYVFIAGTYTPIVVNQFTGAWQVGILTLVWAFAIVGAVVKLFMMHAPRWISVAIYLLMGWMSVAAVGEILNVAPVAQLFWMAAGGLTFTAGAIVYATKALDFKPGVFGFHEVWHLFVIGGSACFYVVIAMWVAAAPV